MLRIASLEATRGSEILVSSTLKAAQVFMSRQRAEFGVRLERSSIGADITSDLSALMAAILDFIAPVRATRNTRIASILSQPDLGSTFA
jgi:hypothetical protein